MNQFESFETYGGKTVVVNKATITYVKHLSPDTAMIYFNSVGNDGQVQAVKVKCGVEEVARILNGE